jgi:hypothetical protein
LNCFADLVCWRNNVHDGSLLLLLLLLLRFLFLLFVLLASAEMALFQSAVV